MKSEEEGISLEAHLLSTFKEDFYGKTIKLALCGFLRPEMKFSGIEALLKQIRTDVGKAKNQLKNERHLKIKHVAFFS